MMGGDDEYVDADYVALLAVAGLEPEH